MNDDELPADHKTTQEIENAFRLFDFSVELVRYHLDPERPFALRLPMILEIQKHAVVGIEADAGQIRNRNVGISGSDHTPPEAFLVKGLLQEFCDYLNDHWHEKTAFYLAAYAMWKLNWIHPFNDGNGRTSRQISYIILCLKLNSILPGSPTIPQQINDDKSHYLEALDIADKKFRGDGAIDVSEMEAMIRSMLAKQLLASIVAAGTEPDLSGSSTE